MIVPALVLIFGFDTKLAIGASWFVILLPTGLFGVLEYWKYGEMRISAGLWIALGVFRGDYFGARMAGTVSSVAMRRLCAVFLLVAAIYFLVAPSAVSKGPAQLKPETSGPETIQGELPPAQVVH